MNVKEKFRKVLEALNLVDKAKSKELTNEDWKAIVDAYQKEFQVTLQDDMAADQASHQNPLDQEAMNQAQAILDSIIVPLNGHDDDQEPKGENGTSTNGKPQNVAPASPETVAQSAGLVKAIVDGLKNQAAADIPVSVATASNLQFNGPGNTAKFLFGIEHPMFSMNNRWNKIAANPRIAAAMEDPEENEEGASFRKEVVSY